jgi:hypothetical protein
MPFGSKENSYIQERRASEKYTHCVMQASQKRLLKLALQLQDDSDGLSV